MFHLAADCGREAAETWKNTAALAGQRGEKI